MRKRGTTAQLRVLTDSEYEKCREIMLRKYEPPSVNCLKPSRVLLTFQPPFRAIDCVERRLRSWPRQYDASKRKSAVDTTAQARRGYARVSMETDRLEHSAFETDRYYSDLIQRHPGWEYAGVFADNGISGTSTNRPEFQRMIAECEAGHIDIILTKRLFRFARNTLDMLVTIRRLKELGISVRFEKEGIDTLTERRRAAADAARFFCAGGKPLHQR